MIKRMFCVYDTKTEMFTQPMFYHSTNEAMRMFGDVVNSDTAVGRHPADYMLYETGTFDDNTGETDNTIPPTMLGVATDFIKADQQTPMFPNHEEK